MAVAAAKKRAKNRPSKSRASARIPTVAIAPKPAAPDIGQRPLPALDKVRPVMTALAIRAGTALAGLSDRTRSATRHFATAVGQHRHGTWLVLFFALFIGLWLLAGWAGIANGIGRGLLVGIATPLAVNALFPLRRAR